MHLLCACTAAFVQSTASVTPGSLSSSLRGLNVTTFREHGSDCLQLETLPDSISHTVSTRPFILHDFFFPFQGEGKFRRVGGESSTKDQYHFKNQIFIYCKNVL